MIKDTEQAPVIASLQALHGVGLITATTVVAEVGDFSRFVSAKQIMSYAGLVPCESSTGDTLKNVQNPYSRCSGQWVSSATARFKGLLKVISSPITIQTLIQWVVRP